MNLPDYRLQAVSKSDMSICSSSSIYVAHTIIIEVLLDDDDDGPSKCDSD